MQKIKKISIFVTCLLICLTSSILFIGCGKKDNEIRVNEVTHSIFYAPMYAAYNLNYFKDEGLSVTIESGSGSDASMTALISGSADIALIGPEQVVYANGKKNQPIIFGQLTQKDGSFIVSKNDMQDFNLNKLKGKTIIGGRAGGFPAMTLQYIIEKARLKIGTNLSSGEVNLRTDVSFPMISSEFVTSNSDFCTLFEPTATNIEKQRNGYVLKAVGDYSGYVPYTCFTATKEYLKNNSLNAEKFLKAVYKGYNYLKTMPLEDAAKSLAPSFSGMTIEELKIAVKQYLSIDAWSDDFVLSEESFATMLDILNSTQGKKLNITYSAKHNQIVDNSIAQKLSK